MKRLAHHLALVVLLACLGILATPGNAFACGGPIGVPCPPTVGVGESSVLLNLSQQMAGTFAPAGAVIPDYQWRLRTLCEISDAEVEACSAMDFRTCPQQPGRVIEYYVLEQRPLVRLDGSAAPGPGGRPTLPSPGLQPGDPAGEWFEAREGCFDVTDLNPPPSPGEVFSYFQRLPLPQLTTQHQPPGDGLAGLPVIFYTDSPTTQTFTVDIRGFTVVITATAEQFTWHTGDATGQVVSTDPGRPYPDQTVEHPYRSGTYTAYLTVTWGATFSVNGSAPAAVPGTTTTDGPAITFGVLQARPVLTNPYD